MKITSACCEGEKLILTAPVRDARRFVYSFKPGEYDINPSKPKRSLDANNYCWSLCSKLADALGKTKEEIYIDAVKAGNQYIMLLLPVEDAQQFQKSWESKGLGWRVEMSEASAENQYVFAYYGSSVYDTKAMSRLIDRLTQECRQLDIETRPEDEVKALLEAWE